MSYSTRLTTTQSHLPAHTALLISDPLDILYLTGFICLTPQEREAYVLVTQNTSYLFLSAFSAPVNVSGLQVVIGGIERQLSAQLVNISQQQQVSTISVDGNSLRYNEFQFLHSLLPSSITITSSKESPLTQQKMIKDAVEIENLTKANAITHQVLINLPELLKAGMTELDVQELIESGMRSKGVKEFAFPTIVCFGAATALPHHQPEDTQLTQNMAVLIDCGAKWNGYCADVTRSFWFGDTPDPKYTQIETIVKEAYEKTMDALKSRSKQIESSHNPQSSFQQHNHPPCPAVASCEGGTTQPLQVDRLQSQTPTKQPSNPPRRRAGPPAGEVGPTTQQLQASQLDLTARDYINASGFGQYFIHTTGHGVGLYIHESPSLNQRNDTVLQAGMVITIEPGIYLPDQFGYRFENSVLITTDGVSELL